MENNQITTNTQLGVYVKQMESGDKAVIITTTNKYVNAKRNNGNVEATYNELLNVIKRMESKYSFNAFEENDDVKAIIEECLSKLSNKHTKVLVLKSLSWPPSLYTNWIVLHTLFLFFISSIIIEAWLKIIFLMKSILSLS